MDSCTPAIVESHLDVQTEAMTIVQPGEKVRVITTVYRNPLTKTGILAKPGDIATIVEWMNAGGFSATLDHNGLNVFLRSKECEPLK